MLAQLARNNNLHHHYSHRMNAPAPLTQDDHHTYAMMLGQSCNSSVNVNAPTCTAFCGIDDKSGTCSTLFDSAVFGYAQSLLDQDY